MSKTVKNLEWHTEQRRIKDLKPFEHNPRKLSEKQYAELKKSLTKFDLAEIPAIDTDNKICAGHQRLKVLAEIKGLDYEIDVRVPNRKLTAAEFKEYNVRSNKNTGEFDMDILANAFELNDLLDWGFDEKELDLDLWESEKTDESVHPTEKPVGLLSYMITNSSNNGDIILDLFAGSGSTLIACEETNRTAFEMELDPVYIDVIIKRYHKLYPDKPIECLTNKNFNFNKLYEEEPEKVKKGKIVND